MFIDLLVIQISVLSIFLPAVIGLFSYQKLNHETKWIAITVFAACIPHVVRSLEKEDPIRYIFYNINIVLELLFLTIFFKRFFLSGMTKVLFRVLVIFCILISCFFVVNGDFTVFQTSWLSLNNTVYSIWCLLLLYQLYKDDRFYLKFSKSLFFYVFGILFYSSCMIFAFGLWDYLESNKNSELKIIKTLHPIFNLLMYTLFSIGFIKEVRSFNSQS